MAADAGKDRAAKAKAKDREAKAKEKEKAAKAKEKEKEKAAKAKEKEKAAKAKERDARAKAKERDAKAKAKEKAAKAKEKEKAAKAKAKDKAKGGSGKAKATEGRGERPAPAETPAPVEQAFEESAVEAEPEQSEAPAEDVAEPAAASADDDEAAALPELDVPANDKTVRPKGYLAEALGKEDAVGRSTQRATVAASYTTRDHDLIRAWAQTRGGRPADVTGTGRGGGAGVLRIEFPDGPGDDSRLEDVDWAPFFQTFDDSDVDFLYQERVRTGDLSRFHKIVRADG